MPIKFFFCYAREDELLLNNLKKHLMPLKRQGLIEMWYDREISAGMPWEEEISKRLDGAQIILLLISPDFIASDYCYGVEMTQALQRHEAGTAQVIPVVVRPVDIQGTPFAHLQFLPRDARPVTSWEKIDEAFLDIVKGIRTVLERYNDPGAGSLRAENTHQLVLPKRAKIPVRAKVVAVVLTVVVLIAGASSIYLLVRPSTGNPLPQTATFVSTSNATPVLSDPLLESNHRNDWSENEDYRFADDGYRITTSIKNYLNFAYADSTTFQDFTYEVQMKIVKGTKGEGGLVYRLDSNEPSGYYFGVDLNGNYRVVIMMNHSNNILRHGHSSAFHAGLNQLNTVRVEAKENIVKLYINNTYVTTTNDATLTSGQIGLAVAPLDSPPVEVIFTNAKVWTL